MGQKHRRSHRIVGDPVLRSAAPHLPLSGHRPMALPNDPKERKNHPVTRGFLHYFPAAIAAVARVSKKGNDQHNPGEPLHWSREKSDDHADCAGRHLIEMGPDLLARDVDGELHVDKLAWRAMALSQIAHERLD